MKKNLLIIFFIIAFSNIILGNSVLKNTNQNINQDNKRIKLDKKSAKDEIDFWGRQMSEHALFLHLGLENKALKDRALKLHTVFEKFIKDFNQNPNENMDKILPLLQKLKTYQMRVKDALASGKWIGWLYPAFINHLNLELNYFVNKLNGKKFSKQDEAKFWNKERSGEAEVTAHLLDPTEAQKVKRAHQLSLKFKNIPTSEEDMFIKLSLIGYKKLNQYFKNLDKAMKNDNLKSIIHPVLAAHVYREGERAISTLSKK